MSFLCKYFNTDRDSLELELQESGKVRHGLFIENRLSTTQQSCSQFYHHTVTLQISIEID